MKNLVGLFIMTVSLFGVLSSATEKSAPALQKISGSTISSAAISNGIFTKVQLIQQNYLRKKDYQKELDSLITQTPQLLQQAKLQAAAFFTAEIAKQQKIKDSAETVKRMEQRQRDIIRHYDELARLLTQLEKNRSTGLFGEKLKELADYLSKSSSGWLSERPTSPARGAAPVVKKANMTKEDQGTIK